MSIDPRYVAAADLQQYLVDKSGSGALSGGYVYFYQDNSRTVLQNVYELTGNAPNYSFSPLPNPVILSPVGTFMDNDGNDIVPYYLPWLIVDGEITDTPSLYYVVVQNSNFIPQFTREAWPPNSFTSGGVTPIGVQTDFNYIPNGQFLIHNNLPKEGLITSTNTILAPGGVVFLVENSLASTNFVTFNAVGTWTDDPPESPQYEINVACTIPNTSETYKALSTRFDDVNKFANFNNYTFGFWAQTNTGSLNVSVNINKYFGEGGSSFTPIEQTIVTITAEPQFFSVPINFGGNSGETIGSGTTWVSVDLSFDTALVFNVSMTDFVMIAGDVTIDDFPAQTNADMITRSVNGWTNVPDYNGFDLYLSPVLTPGGMQYDHTIIGKVEASVGKVAHPGDALTATPPPLGNDMPCDGAAYITADYSTLGIPYARLGNYLIANSPVTNTPMYGTGANFATAYADAGNTSSFRITVNSNGAGIAGASAITTPMGWTFTTIPTYGGSSTGSVSLGFTAYNNIADTILAVNSSTSGSIAATNLFTTAVVGGPNDTTDILCQQNFAFTVLCPAGSTLRTGGASGYFTFSNGTTSYRIWAQTGTETAPSGTGVTLIEIKIQQTDTAQDVANIVRETINAFQSTSIIVNGAPVEGSYFQFQTNPSSTINYIIWYSYLANSTAPSVAGTIPIKVFLQEATPTNAQVVTASLIAINAYQYAAPNFQGMFLRGTDFSGIWDTDVAQRWGVISGLSGANYGTFEYSQFRAHYHNITANTAGVTPTGPSGWMLTSPSTPGFNNLMADTGGSETRPVNPFIEWVIKY